MKLRTLWFMLAGLLVGCAAPQTASPQWTAPILPPTVDPADTVMAAAQHNYETYCAHCHGFSGDGQSPASQERTVAAGYHAVPRHDTQGHTWQHPDQLLFQTIKYGIDNPLTQYIMSGHADRLSDAEIRSVIDYIRRFWTDEQRVHQAKLTAQFAENNPGWEP